MAETTAHSDEVTCEEASELLQELAREVHTEGTADVRVGNKVLTLSPPSAIEYGIEVEERSPMLGGDREAITVTLEWEVDEAES